MKEITGNIFDIKDADAICVPTNGVVKANGELVMGAGLAKQFAQRFPWLPATLGEEVSRRGNVVIPIITRSYPNSWHETYNICSFPTKEHWKNPSSLELIAFSAEQLLNLSCEVDWQKVILPRVGTGLGQLSWEQVKAVLEPILDDRFYIITPKGVK